MEQAQFIQYKVSNQRILTQWIQPHVSKSRNNLIILIYRFQSKIQNLMDTNSNQTELNPQYLIHNDNLSPNKGSSDPWHID